MIDLVNQAGSFRFGSGYGFLPDIFLSAIAWSLVQGIIFMSIYFRKHFKITHEVYLNLLNRMIHFTHSTVISLACCYVTFKSEGDCYSTNSGPEYLLGVSMLGFFVFDFLEMLHFGLLTKSIIFHHVISFAGVGVVCLIEMGGYNTVLGTIVIHGTAPPLQLRMIIKSLGLRYTLAH